MNNKFIIDIKRSSPLHVQVKQNLVRLIESGALKTGDRIPPEIEIARKYNISRGTVRVALAELAREGLINRRQKRGSIVLKKMSDSAIRIGVWSPVLALKSRVMDYYVAELEKSLRTATPRTWRSIFATTAAFSRRMTYDTVSYEVCIGGTLPGHMAICGGQGPIQSRADFDAYPWQELPAGYWRLAGPRLDALVAALPPGMKAVGGVGNGVFELAESLVGLEHLPFIEVDDPQLYADLFCAIGALMCAIWSEFMPRYGRHFAACRFDDDLGFKSSLLTNPATVRNRSTAASSTSSMPAVVHSSGIRAAAFSRS